MDSVELAVFELRRRDGGNNRQARSERQVPSFGGCTQYPNVGGRGRYERAVYAVTPFIRSRTTGNLKSQTVTSSSGQTVRVTTSAFLCPRTMPASIRHPPANQRAIGFRPQRALPGMAQRVTAKTSRDDVGSRGSSAFTSRLEMLCRAAELPGLSNGYPLLASELL